MISRIPLVPKARLAARLLLSALFVWSTAVALAYRPAMEHHEDCPMPLENRGAPTALNAPATPPPEGQVVDGVLPRLPDVVPVKQQYSGNVKVERVRSRGPPLGR